MSRIRYLKPSFFKDEDVAELPFQTRLLYQGLWTLADKEGRLQDRPKWIKAEIFPYEERGISIETMLEQLALPKVNNKRPFINRYEIDGERYIQIIKWNDHQKPHHTEKESIIPPSPPLKDKENGESKLAQSECGVKERYNNGVLTVKSHNKCIPNSLEEVIIYFSSIGEKSVEIAETFYDHFQSNGWKVGGKAPMKDWMASARNWIRSPYRLKQNTTQSNIRNYSRENEEFDKKLKEWKREANEKTNA